MGDNAENALCGRHVYICGKSHSKNSEIYGTLKEKLIVDLANRCFVRSHASPVADLIDAYYAIVSSNVFVFILDAHNIMDVDCLNQLGVAISYNIPVVAVRESSFKLPKALPMRFYETKISYKKSGGDSDKAKSVAGNSASVTLASALTNCYGTSIAYTTSSYVVFFEQLLNCLRNLKLEHCYASEGSVSEEEDTQRELSDSTDKTGDKVVVSSQAVGANKRKAWRTNRSPQTKTSKKLSDIYGLEPSKLLTRQKIVSHKKFNTNVLPNRSKSPPTKSHSRKPKSPQRNSTSSNQNTKNNTNNNNHKSRLNSNHTNVIEHTEENDESSVNHTKHTININHIASSPVFRRESDVKVGDTNKKSSQSELALPNNTKYKRSNLRRVSSLPVVPTQYLVASDNNRSPQILSYPLPTNSALLCPRSDSPIQLSGDESDFGTIHLSRSCTPVDNIDSFIVSYSTDESSR